ncbi:MAG: dihydrodipicolinate synthase family protein [Prolixibacteraceae bacterium]|jgi:4-hydroxy-tetrahydrodipicolinate synthase|nr:dihydrodipicolinate synthase family protein [Prolixibacteraceae bacterium]MDD4756185.1 dihydrodipicolinate synthase family protein [Prolixibacteraceae bacterium]
MSEILLKGGFYPALGTPTDEDGKLNKKSFITQIELMLESGAAGMLCLGSMGKMTSIREREYKKIATVCSELVSGKVPVMTGVMDCSALRVIDRIESLGRIDIEGVVATSPFYSRLKPDQVINFFRMVSKESGYPLYIYDLPSVTQSPVTKEILLTLMKEDNIKGIKTANLDLILDLKRNDLFRKDFEVFFSGLDLFDAALKMGVTKNLDGMFTCTPRNSKAMYFSDDDQDIITCSLKNILKLRNIFAKETIVSGYTYSMELLGCGGSYHRDFDPPVSEKLKTEIYECMKEIKEI